MPTFIDTYMCVIYVFMYPHAHIYAQALLPTCMYTYIVYTDTIYTYHSRNVYQLSKKPTGFLLFSSTDASAKFKASHLSMVVVHSVCQLVNIGLFNLIF